MGSDRNPENTAANTAENSDATPFGADVIDLLADASQASALRPQRAQAKANAQRAFSALLEPGEPGRFSHAERYAVAAYTALLHDERRAGEFYLDLLADEAEPADGADDPVAAVRAAAAATAAAGPYGVYREPGLAAENAPGAWVGPDHPALVPLGARAAAACALAHLMVCHPRDARPQVWQPLAEAGWATDEAVSLAQLIAFLCFQLRVVRSLRVIAGTDDGAGVGDGDGAGDRDGAGAGTSAAGAPSSSATPEAAGSAALPIAAPELVGPQHFVSHALGWRPWLEPVAERALTGRQREALIKPERAKQPYFRLLARDPEALEARTLTDLDIFYNTDGGLPRAEREFAAAVTSRYNGCVYCASVHAGRTLDESTGREADVERLLAAGPDAEAGSPAWNAVRDAAVALTATPPRLAGSHVAALRSAGLDETAVLDALNAVAFFNWANRLMLVLGEPELPRRFR